MSEEPDPPPAHAQPDRDPDTVVRLHAGDPEGLRQLFIDHGGTVRMRLRQSFGRLLDDSELDEVLSMTSIRVWKAATRFDPQLGTLRAWVSVIARNCGLKFIEKRRRLRDVERSGDVDSLAQVAPSSSTLSEKERQKLLEDTLACVHKLPPMQRAILLADFEAGHPASAELLAARLRTSVNSIYVSRHKGRQSLRKALRNLGHRTTDEDERGLETV